MTRKDNLRLHELQVRTVQIAHLGSMLTDMFSLPDVLSDFLDSCAHSKRKDLIPLGFVDFFEMAEKDDPDGDAWEDAFVEYVHHRELYGFLVQAHKPVDSSWGHCRSQWFYGGTWNDVMALIEAWGAIKLAKAD